MITTTQGIQVQKRPQLTQVKRKMRKKFMLICTVISDKVRISKYERRVFDKDYTPNWTEEIFTVDKSSERRHFESQRMPPPLLFQAIVLSCQSN